MDSNRAQLSYVLETDFGVIPATPVFKILRTTGEDLKAAKDTVVSAEIRADRQVADLAKVNSGASGGFKFEWSYGAYSSLIAAALGTTGIVVNQTAPMTIVGQVLTKDGVVKATATLTGTNTPANNDTVTLGVKTYTFKTTLTDGVVANEVLIGGSLAIALDNLKAAVNNAGGVSGTDYGSATTANATIEATTNTATTQLFQALTGGTAGNALAATEVSANLSFGVGVTTLLGGQAATWLVEPVPGQFLRVSGFVTTANNGPKRVVSVTSTAVTFAAGSFTFDEAGVSGTIVGTAYRNGISLPTFTFERKLVNNAAADFYQRYLGMGVDEWNMSITTAKINEGSFGFIGASADTDDDLFAGATYAAAPTNQVQNATSHVTAIFQGGTTSTEHLTALEFAVKNNVRAKNEIGRDGAFELGLGEFTLTGKVSAYFKDNTFYAAMIAHDYSSLAWVTTDAAGNSMGFHLPKINFMPGDPNATAKNTDIMLELPFQAILDPVSGYSFIVTEMPAA
jgi:hypothetical protein